ncbi:hypothetical protein CC78DRAFT_621653 [Lojkania enalia]|uniref:Uncharacterized protein n=1 Tax=Lojkania enalia TaxID=147567 RepID=A0A9P4K0V7_9PLEO|nr:hypothetical protein CC78DRAFT_621653 [Didymosphaeria enalia]
MADKKVSKTALTFVAKNALLYDQVRFLTKINNEGKSRRETKSTILGTAKVMTYEDLTMARAEHVAKEARQAEIKAKKAAKKAAKQATNVASTPLQVEEGTASKKRGRKRKSTKGADALEPTAKVAQISNTHVAEGS